MQKGKFTLFRGSQAKKRQALQVEQERRAQQLRDLGLRLRESRQAQGISLEQVSLQTRIQLRLLRAIESGNLDPLPEPVYIHGFIKKFAEALGLDGDELANGFSTGLALKPVKSSWRNLPAAQLRPLHLYLLYVLVIICAVNALSYLMNRSSNPQTVGLGLEENRLSADSLDREQRTSSASPGIALPNSNWLSQNSVDKAVRVKVVLTSQSWIQVVADGRTEFEGVLTEGTQRSWGASERLILRAGNAGGVMVAVNDGQAKKLGEVGTVEEITLDAKSQATIRLGKSGSEAEISAIFQPVQMASSATSPRY